MVKQISPEIENEWVRRIEHGEGFLATETPDTMGTCIGYGHNLMTSGKGWDYVNKFLGKPKNNRTVTKSEAERLCKEDLKPIYEGLDSRFPWWRNLDSETQFVMVDMSYTLGIDGFAKFKNTIAAIKEGDYGKASQEILNSQYAQQTGNRALRNAELMRTGHWFDGKPPKNNLATRKKTTKQNLAQATTKDTMVQDNVDAHNKMDIFDNLSQNQSLASNTKQDTNDSNETNAAINSIMRRKQNSYTA